MTIQQEAYRLIDGLSDGNVKIVIEFIRNLSKDGAADMDEAIPNRETIEAISEISEMKAHPEKYKSYATFQELLDDVMGDSDHA